MNLAGHQVGEYLVDHPMPLQQVPAREGLRLDPHGIVPSPVARSRMTRVAGTVVPHRYLCRRKA